MYHVPDTTPMLLPVMIPLTAKYLGTYLCECGPPTMHVVSTPLGAMPTFYSVNGRWQNRV